VILGVFLADTTMRVNEQKNTGRKRRRIHEVKIDNVIEEISSRLSEVNGELNL
jgi:hypothetical protein